MSAFQRPAVNWLVVTIQWPSGLKLPVLTAKKWPMRTWSRRPVRDLQMRRVWSALTVTSSRPFGEYSASVTSERWPRQRVEELAGRGVPELGDLALRRRDTEPARREDGVRRRDVDRARPGRRPRCRRAPSPPAGRGSARRRSRGRARARRPTSRLARRVRHGVPSAQRAAAAVAPTASAVASDARGSAARLPRGRDRPPVSGPRGRLSAARCRSDDRRRHRQLLQRGGRTA